MTNYILIMESNDGNNGNDEHEVKPEEKVKLYFTSFRDYLIKRGIISRVLGSGMVTWCHLLSLSIAFGDKWGIYDKIMSIWRRDILNPYSEHIGDVYFTSGIFELEPDSHYANDFGICALSMMLMIECLGVLHPEYHNRKFKFDQMTEDWIRPYDSKENRVTYEEMVYTVKQIIEYFRMRELFLTPPEVEMPSDDKK